MSEMTLADRFFVDAMSPAFQEDPYPHYEAYRGRARLLRVADTMWLSFSHGDVTALLRHPKLSSDETRATTEVGRGATGRFKANSLVFMDPPDHTRLRRLVAHAFTPKRVADLRLTAEAITSHRLDETAAAYLEDLLAFRRARPGDDLLSALLAVEADGDRITPEEVVDLALLLLIAGHETTVNLLGNGILALLRAPGQLDLLRRSPDLVAGAVDELLRFDSPVQMTQRVATEDLDLAGYRVRAGDEILLVLGAANRDPQVFAEPTRLDVTRDARSHVAFGGGIHHCLGASLARLQGQVALSALLARFSHLELAGRPIRRPTFNLRGLESLPVVVDAVSRRR